MPGAFAISNNPAMEARRIMEHRWGRRIACGAPIRLSVSADVAGAGRLRNVSMSGAFIETALDLQPFARVTIGLRDVEILATVMRIAPDGVGVEWCETAPRAICPVLGCANPCAAANHSRD